MLKPIFLPPSTTKDYQTSKSCKCRVDAGFPFRRTPTSTLDWWGGRGVGGLYMVSPVIGPMLRWFLPLILHRNILINYCPIQQVYPLTIERQSVAIYHHDHKNPREEYRCINSHISPPPLNNTLEIISLPVCNNNQCGALNKCVVLKDESLQM